MVNFYIQREGEAPVDIETTYGIRVCSVHGLHPSDYKPLFKRDWSNEDGVDVYVPLNRRKSSRDVTITVYLEAQDYLDKWENFCTFVSEKKFDYWDTLRNRKVGLVRDSDLGVKWVSYTQNKIYFELTFLNYSGNIIKL